MATLMRTPQLNSTSYRAGTILSELDLFPTNLRGRCYHFTHFIDKETDARKS